MAGRMLGVAESIPTLDGLNVGGSVSVSGNSTRFGNETITGLLNVQGTVSVSGPAYMTGTVSVGGPAVLAGGMSVSGGGTIVGATAMKGNASVSGAFAAGAAASDVFGVHGFSGSVQSTFVSTLPITAISVSGVVGFASSGALSNALTLINVLQQVLINHGLMASA